MSLAKTIVPVIQQKKLSLTVNIMCPPDKDAFGNNDPRFDSFSGDSCDIEINYTSVKGCPVFSFDALHIFLENIAFSGELL